MRHASRMSARPIVSVIVTAHNRSNVLRHAIDSALRQSVADFVIQVWCDGCTDDSAAVARGFGDPRIEVIELTPKLGHQARVTNMALERTGTRWVAFLNQDDLWLPDHLERLLLAAESGDATVAVARLYAWTARGPRLGPHGYDPLEHYPMSARLVRREVFGRVGRFRDPSEILCLPSDEWLFRAWRRGERIAFSEVPSLVKIDSLVQGRSYEVRAEAEQVVVHGWLVAGNAREELDRAVATARAATPARPRWRRRSTGEWIATLREQLRSRAVRMLYRVVMRFGVPPQSVQQWLRGRRRRGDFQRWIDRERGTG
jgi:glycosyltransferase involved in cell wall biosynthesis